MLKVIYEEKMRYHIRRIELLLSLIHNRETEIDKFTEHMNNPEAIIGKYKKDFSYFNKKLEDPTFSEKEQKKILDEVLETGKKRAAEAIDENKNKILVYQNKIPYHKKSIKLAQMYREPGDSLDDLEPVPLERMATGKCQDVKHDNDYSNLVHTY